MKKQAKITFITLAVSSACSAYAFDSNSTGADGAFEPQVDTTLALPDDGVFNFTSINIPEGVTVTFKKNTINTPVYWLVSGDVTINGTVNLDGSPSTDSGTAGDGIIADDGIPGEGGPGGYPGGTGGEVGEGYGGPGVGPGGPFVKRCGYGSLANSYYMNQYLLPLIGGSGGSGGCGDTNYRGSGGGGGGGAILIAASGNIDLSGSITAQGADAGGAGGGYKGGSGSGGAVRIVATSVSGNGVVNAGPYINDIGGKVRMEAEVSNYTGLTYPNYSFGEPGALFIAGLPSVRITQIGDQVISDQPTGTADASFPSDLTNPVTVQFETTGVPVGNTIKLVLYPDSGEQVEVISPALTGSTDLATASVEINLPTGASKLLASTTYTVTVAAAEALAQYTNGEAVKSVELLSGIDATKSQAKLITKTGKTVLISLDELHKAYAKSGS